MNEIEQEDTARDRKILKLLGKSEKLLATILISNNFINITIIVLSNYALSSIVDFGGSQLLEFLFITVLLTFLLLLFGEIMPKIYSAHNPLKFCRFSAPAIAGLEYFFTPVSALLVRSTRLANRVPMKQGHSISVDELEQALELTDKKELCDEQNILEGIIRFGDESAKEVMTARLDMVSLDIQESYSAVLKSIAENVYSRIPVFSDTIDTIKGILYIKDLLPHLNKGDNFRWQSLVRPAYFVPETKKIDDLLRDFQTNKIHIAIVVDEFGGTSGLITLEDVIEEIVGEINDEYDEEDKLYLKLNSNTFVFEGKISLTDFCKVLDLDDDAFDDVSGDADSLAGLLLEIKGDFPSPKEVIDYRNFSFEITEMDERRIVKVKVVIHPVDHSKKDKVDATS